MTLPQRKRRFPVGRIFGVAVMWSSLALAIMMIALWNASYSRIYTAYLRWYDWPEENISRLWGPGFRIAKGSAFISWSHNEFNLDEPEGIGSVWSAEYADKWRAENPGGLNWDYSARKIPGEAEARALAASPPGTIVQFDHKLGIESHGGFGYKHTERANRSRTDRWTWYMFPAWLPVVLFSIPPAVGLAGILRRRHRRKRERCPRCGYDLRGATTAARCPECGAAPPVTRIEPSERPSVA